MNPDQFKSAATKIFGRKKWQVHLAEHLGCNVSTIHRLMKREQIPGPYEVALQGMLEHRKRQIALEKEARRLLPRKVRRKKNERRDTGRARAKAGAAQPQPGDDRPTQTSNMEGQNDAGTPSD
jgi:hypothetical protein